MPTVFKNGDKVSVVGVVQGKPLADGSLTVSIEGTRIYPRRDLVSLLEPNIEPGEMCCVSGKPGYKFIARHNGHVWVESTSGEHAVTTIEEISRPETQITTS